MILEAFAEYLQSAEKNANATELLNRWLWQKLSTPPLSVVDRVLHCEIGLSPATPLTVLLADAQAGQEPISDRKLGLYLQSRQAFKGNSASGSRLLKSLYEYCLSYEQQKWSRWVHSLKASDFKEWKKI